MRLKGHRCRVRRRGESGSLPARGRIALPSAQGFASAEVPSRTAAKTFPTDGLQKDYFQATICSSTSNVKWSRLPSTNSTSTSGRRIASTATRAAKARILLQTDHCQTVTRFTVLAPFGDK